MLSDPDPPVRLAACEALFFVDARRALELALPLLEDPESGIRWFVCGCLHDCGDKQAIARLIRVLQDDSDAQIRGSAAHALGGIGRRTGSPAAIPALLAAMESDHESDMHGHSPRSSAATALDDILGTNETRIRQPDGLCMMRRGEPDLGLLRRLAVERFEHWSNGRDEPGASADGGRDPPVFHYFEEQRRFEQVAASIWVPIEQELVALEEARRNWPLDDPHWQSWRRGNRLTKRFSRWRPLSWLARVLESAGR